VATKKERTGRVDVMSHEAMAAVDDQSHYEISLTAGQAFVAFVLLLLSLAASFAFGLMIGKGQGDERLIVRKEPVVITEAGLGGKKPAGRIVELGVADDDFKQSVPPATASAATSTIAPIVTEVAPPNASGADAPATAAGSEPVPTTAPTSTPPRTAATETHPAAAAPAPAAAPAIKSGPAYAQLLSTGDQKTAEALAAKVIDRGFTSAYVERNTTDKGTIFRVRVRFPSEADARAAEPRLREFSKDVWITR
jgi:cell division septation protein DedD